MELNILWILQRMLSNPKEQHLEKIYMEMDKYQGMTELLC